MDSLDGRTVAVGLRVYDLAFGAGRIHSYTQAVGFEAVFDSGIKKGYDLNGKMLGFANRTLYWSPPTVRPPLNDPDKNATYMQLVNVIYAVLGGRL